jgi:phage terminase large subunit GpA-like protein
MNNGIPRLRWILPKGKRNEALDCNVMALAAFNIIKPNLELLAKQNLVYTGIKAPKLNQPATARRVLSKGA